MLKLFLTFMIILVIIDSIWVLGANKLHSSVVKRVQKSELSVDLIAALMFYLLVPLAYIFLILPLSKNETDAFKYGILLGALMYGTFDLTNKAIFKDYPWSYTVADMTWGALCIGVVSFITYKIK